MFLNILDQLYERYNVKLAYASALFLPLKLFFAYLFLIPLIVLWLVHNRRQGALVLRDVAWLSVPFILFTVSVFCSALFGMNPSRSLLAVPRLLFFACTILVVRDAVLKSGTLSLLLMLLSGQAIAGLHSVIDSALPGVLPRVFLGQVTESGQLGLTLLAASGLLIFLNHRLEAKEYGATQRWMPLCVGVLLSLSAILFGFSHRVHFESTDLVLLGALFFGLAIAALLMAVKASRRGLEDLSVYWKLAGLYLPLMGAALLVNLKRGPWAGVFVGSAILFLVHMRRLVVPLVIAVVAMLVFVEPVKQRILRSSGDFFIAGGRSEIWDIGVELATRYPLGIGYQNSSTLSKFSYRIPPQMRHFHNNFINIVAENGWISLCLYLWWLVSILKAAFCYPSSFPEWPLAVALGCAVLSWQIAGLVEYNFGDSEVVLTAYMIIGLLAALVARQERAEAGR